jgi:putative ABC transport system permease protein
MLLRLALRNLTRQRRRTLLVLMAVAWGTLAVTGVRGFLNGLQRELVRGFAEGQVGALVIHRQGFADSTDVAPLSPSITVTDELLARIERVPGVKRASPRITLPALVSVGDESTFALVVAADPARENVTAPKRSESLTGGTWLTNDSLNAGHELLRGLKGKQGDKLAVLANDPDGVMNAIEAPVAGTLASAVQGEKKLVVIPLAKGQELVRMPNQATEIAVAVHDLDNVARVKAALQTAVGPDYRVRTWKEVAAFAADVVATQDKALGVIIVVFLIVILMGLMNAMLATVLERTREIGTMIAVGARRRTVVALFVLEASLIGLLGAIVGSLLGNLIVLALAVKGIDLTAPGATLPQHLVPFIKPRFVVQMILMGTIGAAIAALYPAWRASRLDPVKALAST